MNNLQFRKSLIDWALHEKHVKYIFYRWPACLVLLASYFYAISTSHLQIKHFHSLMLTWNLEQKLNLTREAKNRQKNLMMTSCQQIVTSLQFFQFTDNLEQSGSRIRGCTVCETYIFNNSNLLSCKN